MAEDEGDTATPQGAAAASSGPGARAPDGGDDFAREPATNGVASVEEPGISDRFDDHGGGAGTVSPGAAAEPSELWNLDFGSPSSQAFPSLDMPAGLSSSESVLWPTEGPQIQSFADLEDFAGLGDENFEMLADDLNSRHELVIPTTNLLINDNVGNITPGEPPSDFHLSDFIDPHWTLTGHCLTERPLSAEQLQPNIQFGILDAAVSHETFEALTLVNPSQLTISTGTQSGNSWDVVSNGVGGSDGTSERILAINSSEPRVSDIVSANFLSLHNSPISLGQDLPRCSTTSLDQRTHTICKGRELFAVQEIVRPRLLELAPRPSGTVQVTAAPQAAKKVKRRRGLTSEERKKTKLMRKTGVCLRCRIYKVACDGGNPCRKCLKVENSARKYLEPCYRDDLDNVAIVRHGSSRFGQLQIAFRSYLWCDTSLPPKVVTLRWIIPRQGDLELPNIEVDSHEFKPGFGDVISESWQTSGKVTTVELPPYAMYDTNELARRVEEYVVKTRPLVEKYMIDSITHELAALTFAEVARYIKKHKTRLLQLVFNICTTSILAAGWWSIVSDENLGINYVDGAESGYIGQWPVPPAMSHQINVVLLNMLNADQRAIITELKWRIFKPDPKPWYEIFLAYFVILCHLQYIHGEATGYLRSQELTMRASQVSHIIRAQVEEYGYSAQNMLHHFKGILKGYLPFVVADKKMEELKTRENLDDGAVDYLRKAVQYLKDTESYTRDTVNCQEGNDDLQPNDCWVRQLFKEQWK